MKIQLTAECTCGKTFGITANMARWYTSGYVNVVRLGFSGDDPAGIIVLTVPNNIVCPGCGDNLDVL